MMKYALFTYVPQRKLQRSSFESQDLHRMILGFKDGINVYSRWAAREMARALMAVDLTDVTVVCVPASTRYASVRRWKLFSSMLCELTGALNGFDRIQVKGSRKRVHVSGERELASNIKHYVHINERFFKGKKVLLIDDIVTTGATAAAFQGALEAAGATVVMSMFLAKTKRFPPRGV